MQVDTNFESPDDFVPQGLPGIGSTYNVAPHSSILLEAKNWQNLKLITDEYSEWPAWSGESQNLPWEMLRFLASGYGYSNWCRCHFTLDECNQRDLREHGGLSLLQCDWCPLIPLLHQLIKNTSTWATSRICPIRCRYCCVYVMHELCNTEMNSGVLQLVIPK